METAKINLEKFLSDKQKKDINIKLLIDLYVDDVKFSFYIINDGIQFYEISKLYLLKC